jgi:hypothetical protein
MKRTARGAAVVWACGIAFTVGVAGESPYTGPKATEQYLFCTASRQAHELPDETVVPGVGYYSAAFAVMPQDTNAVADAFLAYLKKTYKFEPEPGAPQPVACTGVASLEEAKSLRAKRLATAKDTIDTGWTFEKR